MASDPYIIGVTAYKGIYEGYTKLSLTVDDGGGQEAILSLSGGTELAISQLITLTHSSGILTETTNSNGQVVFDLANLGSYSEGDTVVLSMDTKSSHTENQESLHRGAKAQKNILVDKFGKAYDETYPFPINLFDKLNGHPDVMGNVKTEIAFAFASPDSRPATETVTFVDGVQYRRTFSYDSGKRLIGRSRWEKV